MTKMSLWSDRVSHLNGRPRDFAQLDVERIDVLTDQLGGDELQPQKETRKIGLSLTGPSIELGSELGKDESPPRKVDRVLRLLQKADLLSHHRPIVTPARGEAPPFVLEKMRATPVILPVSGLREKSGIKSFRVWISEPDPLHHDGPDWSFRGSFLFLTEIIFDEQSYHSVYSGCSALRFIVNASHNLPMLSRGGGDVFGRESNLHPLEKLQSIGGVVGDTRVVEALYRIRYMTDEQVYVHDGAEHRVHDILGYPLFISW